MKKATQLAMLGTGIIVIIKLFFIISSVLKLDFWTVQIYITLHILELLASVAIFNFFYILFQKQNNKSDKDE